MQLLKMSADKLFWIFFSIYAIWIIIEVGSYFAALKYMSEETSHNNFFLIKLMLPVALVSTGVLFKVIGWKKISNIIMGVPAVIAGSIFLITVLMWLFLAIVFIFSGK